MIGRYAGISVGVTVLVTAGMLGPVAASAAATRQVVTSVGRDGRLVTAPRAITSSQSNAGYIGGVSKPTTTFAATVTVPTADCSSAPPNPTIIDVFLNGQLSSSDYSGSGAQIVVSCSNGTPSYEAALILDDQAGPNIAVSPGDHVQFTGTATATRQRYELNDVTSGVTSGVANAGKGGGLTASNLQLTTQGGFGTAGGFPPFGTIKYSALKLDGTVFKDSDPTGYRQVDAKNHVMIRTSAISGDAFTLTYVANS